MNEGTSRQGSVNQALKADYISIDDRSILDMMKYTLDLSKKLNFYELNNIVLSDWEAFFLKDGAFIIAKITNTDINYFKEEHARILDEPWNVLYTALAVENIITVIHKVVHWSDVLVKSNYQGTLLREMNQLIDSMAKDIPDIKNWIKQLDKLPFDKRLKTRILKIFNELEGHIKNQHNFDIVEADDKFDFYEDEVKTRENLHLLFDSIYEKLIFLKESASKKIEAEIDNAANHLPHIGLLLTFFKLSRHVKKDINQLTKKHLDYYYRDLLQQPKPKQLPHQACVAIQPQQEVDDIEIAKGTRFDFIFDNDLVLNFKAANKLQVNKAVIADIRTLHKSEYSPFDSRSHDDDFMFNKLYDSSLLVNGANYINLTEEKHENLSRVMGEDYTSEIFSETINHSEIGFMISSPALLMEKGKQKVILRLNFTLDSFQKAEDLFNTLVNQEILEIKGKVSNTGELKKRTMINFFREAFDIYISEFEGWKKLDHFKVNPNNENSSLTITLDLEKNYENLVSLQKEVHFEDFESEWPCIKIFLNNDAIHHPYSILKHLVVHDIEIEAIVSEVQEVNFSNSLGPLDNSIPFTPFGPAPKIGSYLRLENPLILQKNLTKLQLNLEWNGLPQDRNGFREYYDAYNSTINNSSFKALINQTNKLDSKLQEIALFESSNTSSSLKNSKAVEVQLEKLAFNNLINPSEEVYISSSLYLILKSPEMAFGHHIFSNIYSEAALLKGRFRKKSIVLPKQPYTPLLEKLTLNYTNYAKEIMSRKKDDKGSDIKFMHLHPFGYVQVFPGPIKSKCFLLPQIKYKGNLFIGLKNIQAGDLVSIGFDLAPAVYDSTIIKNPKIEWEYLTNNEWVSNDSLLMEDTTGGLIKSGIVKIEIPAHPQLDNTSLPKGVFWIRAASKEKESLNSKLKSVFTNALALSCDRNLTEAILSIENENRMPKINMLANSAKNVNIIGPFDLKIKSNSISTAVSNSQISERLRHKNRAVSTWDFERLILQKFAQIQKVRVYGRNSHPELLVKGSSIQIVLIPKINSSDFQLKSINKVPYNLLIEIKNFVKQFVSPFVHLEVSNPIYELLKVRCKVKFRDFQMPGELQNQLNEDLIRFLSPAMEDETYEKGFDARISKTQILNFVERRPYVEYVTSFSVLQLVEVDGKYRIIDTAISNKIELLRTISAYAILTSVSRHNIQIINALESEKSKKSGIEDLLIESDFIISDSQGKYK